MIRKAEKSGIKIVLNPPDKLNDFYELYKNFNLTKGLQHLPVSFFEIWWKL